MTLSGERHRLAELTDVITKGTTPKTLGRAYVPAGTPFLRAENIQDLSVRWNGDVLFIDDETDQMLARSRVRAGDVLISIAGTIGRVGVVPANAPSMNCNQAVAIVRPRPALDRRYLAHWLSSPDAQNRIARAQVTATISNLSLSELGSLELPVPPIPEQRHIADLLDTANAVRRKRRAAIALTEELLRSMFLEMFGDPVTDPKGHRVERLENVSSRIDYGVTASAAKEAVGPKFLRITDIQENHVDWASVPYCNVDAEMVRAARLVPGDIVFARTGATTGKSFLIESCPEGAVFASYLIRVRPTDTLRPRFLSAFFQSEAYWRQIRMMAEGAAQPGVNSTKLGALQVPVPPLAEQDAFVSMADSVSELGQRMDISAAEADNLFDSLQQRAFTGELGAR